MLYIVPNLRTSLPLPCNKCSAYSHQVYTNSALIRVYMFEYEQDTKMHIHYNYYMMWLRFLLFLLSSYFNILFIVLCNSLFYNDLYLFSAEIRNIWWELQEDFVGISGTFSAKIMNTLFFSCLYIFIYNILYLRI